ncbi:hypothetical protein [Rhodococcus sp. NPDC006774]|uniref:hypothetical protein n=1 Tax=Rhodococcus sp. NPDC006774 TaxID=3157186 RepID=UPI0033E503B9
MSAVISESNPLRGEATYEGCSVTWTEKDRDESTVRVAEKSITPGTECTGDLFLTVSDSSVRGAFPSDGVGTFVLYRD